MNVRSEPDDRFLDAVDDLEFERRARVVMPDLDRVDAVPVRAFAAASRNRIAVDAGLPPIRCVSRKVSR
jgi:hypothetical protein